MNALLEHKWGVSLAQDHVWAQVAGMAPRSAVRQFFMVLNLRGFMDESMSGYPTGDFVIGGHIATVEAWADFAKDWELLLPQGTRAKNGNYHFKMSEMAASPERMRRVPNFYRVIEDHVITSISCHFGLEEFELAKHRTKQILLDAFRWDVDFALFNNPYFVGFRGLLDHFHIRRKEFKDVLPPDRQVDFYFDDRTEKKPILDAWNDYLDNQEEVVRNEFGSTPRFEDDQKFLPLQAADLWAWWCRYWYEHDATPLPDKMAAFDFGEWCGKKRPCIAINMNEDELVDTLQSLAFASFPGAPDER